MQAAHKACITVGANEEEIGPVPVRTDDLLWREPKHDIKVSQICRFSTGRNTPDGTRDYQVNSKKRTRNHQRIGSRQNDDHRWFACADRAPDR